MDLVFSTDQIDPAKRYASWRDAICDVYVHVEVKATDPDNYKGFIRETRFGDIALTDILLSEQRINRGAHHISQLDKDCYYLQLLHYGRVNVVQRGDTRASNVARGALFSASEQYELQCMGEVRALYLEIPRDQLAQRFAGERAPVTATVNCTQGLGRIATEFCAALATEGAGLAEPMRAELGSQLMDMLALTLSSPDGGMSTEGSVRRARLRSVQQWIEEHLAHPGLTLERIAQANGISLRYLHLLFKGCEMSASEWIWHRRLQRAYDLIAKGGGRSITSIAFDHGFSSSAHFSTMFRRKYGLSPRDVSRSRQ